MIPDPSKLPDQLKKRDQWVLWSQSTDPPKCPLGKDVFKINWKDPANWLSLNEAIAIAKTNDEFDGIGYIIHEEDPIVGLDVDGCFNERYQLTPKDWAPDLSVFEGTYIEYSISGTNSHPFVERSTLPDWWNDIHFDDREHEGVEAYTGKFFIVSGKPVEQLSAPTIEKTNINQFLRETYESVTGELPSLPGNTGADRNRINTPATRK